MRCLPTQATPEKLEIKRALIESLHETFAARPETLLGTNTSSLSISRLASFAPFPAKVVGAAIHPALKQRPTGLTLYALNWFCRPALV